MYTLFMGKQVCIKISRGKTKKQSKYQNALISTEAQLNSRKIIIINFPGMELFQNCEC